MESTEQSLILLSLMEALFIPMLAAANRDIITLPFSSL